MVNYFFLFIAGFMGGVLRGLVGFIKHQFAYKNVGFNLKYFLGMMFLSGVVGVITASAVKEIGIESGNMFFSPALALVVGYAGGDFLENLYKIIAKKLTFYEKA